MTPNPSPQGSPGDERGYGHSPAARLAPPSSPSAGPETTDRMTVLAHELANMLDGSMRWLGLVVRTLPVQGEGVDPRAVETARGQIETVRVTLGRMAELVEGVMRPGSVPMGKDLLGRGHAVTLGEAIDHAVDVIRPFASEFGVGIEVKIEREAGLRRAGPLYPVVLNGLRNAIEAIERSTSDAGRAGHVEVSARIERWMEPRLVVEIVDDGPGLGTDDEDWAFGFAKTSKRGGGGIGLPVSRSLVSEAGGVIELRTRADRKDSLRPGAILRVTIPIHDLLDDEAA